MPSALTNSCKLKTNMLLTYASVSYNSPDLICMIRIINQDHCIILDKAKKKVVWLSSTGPLFVRAPPQYFFLSFFEKKKSKKSIKKNHFFSFLHILFLLQICKQITILYPNRSSKKICSHNNI